jgi:hypothetical protein
MMTPAVPPPFRCQDSRLRVSRLLVDMAFSKKAVMAMYAFAAIISSSGHVEPAAEGCRGHALPS